MKWVSVKERLPEKGRHFLVYSPDRLNKGVFCAYHFDGQWQAFPMGSYCSDMLVYNITHWAELPEPPNE